MYEATCNAHLPYQPLRNPAFILPDVIVKEELLDVKVHTLQAMKLENPKYIVPIVNVKQELLNVELGNNVGLDIENAFEYTYCSPPIQAPPHQPLKLESPTEVLPTIALKEDFLDIKDETGILHDLLVSEDDRVECKSDNEYINLRDGSNEYLKTLCEEDTEGYITVHHNTASPGSGMQLPLKVIPSSLSDCKISGVLQYSGDTVKNGMCKKEKISSVESTANQAGLFETVIKNKPNLHDEIFNISEKIVVCNDNKINSCENCHKCFSTPYSLKIHKRFHTGSKPYTCDTCHKCFSDLSNLNRHTIIHTGSKPYTCDTCHKGFSQISNLRAHTRIHTGSKPYTCDTCHVSFSYLSALKTHTTIHTGSKPYTCDTCHISFSCLSNLSRHTRIHTGSKPYTCDTCHKCFSDLSNLNRHTRIHTGSKP